MGEPTGVLQGLLRDAGTGAIEADIRAELEAHLELCVEDLLEGGRTPEQAHAEARLRFGDLDETLRACRRAKLGGQLAMQRLQWILIAVLAASTLLFGLRAQSLSALAAAERNHAMAQAQSAMEALTRAREPVEHIVIGVGDRLQVKNDTHAEVSQVTEVQADGQALFRHVGWVDVAGRTRQDVEELLGERYRQYLEEVGPVYVLVDSPR